MEFLSNAIRHFSRETFSSLIIRNYRLYYIGQIISTSGMFIQSIAQSWLVLQLTGSGTALGFVTALQVLPMVFFGPFGGIAADRIDKRKILLVTQSVLGILALTLGILVAAQLAKLWMVYILAFCLGLVNVFDMPTRQTFIMELVGTENLRNAITLYSILFNLARVIGPAIAGLLIEVYGLAPCFIITGLSYAVAVMMIAILRAADLFTVPPVAPERGQLREGFNYLTTKPVLLTTVLMMAIMGTFTFVFPVSLPLIAKAEFNGDAGSYAFLTSAMGIGAVIGGVFFARSKAVSAEKQIRAALMFSAAVLASAFMPSLLLTGLAMVAVGITLINYASLSNSIMQLESSAQMRGRVMSFYTMSFMCPQAVGGPIIGWVGEIAGPRLGLALGGLAGFAAVAIGAVRLRKASQTKTSTPTTEN